MVHKRQIHPQTPRENYMGNQVANGKAEEKTDPANIIIKCLGFFKLPTNFPHAWWHCNERHGETNPHTDRLGKRSCFIWFYPLKLNFYMLPCFNCFLGLPMYPVSPLVLTGGHRTRLISPFRCFVTSRKGGSECGLRAARHLKYWSVSILVFWPLHERLFRLFMRKYIFLQSESQN